MDKILSIRGLSKSFGAVPVLHNINWDLEAGEAHALLGANGAGKSTLIKIIGGIIQKTAGEIIFRGKKSQFSSPIDAAAGGIQIIHQELSIIPQLTVLENFFLGREYKYRGFLDNRTMAAEYERVCREMNFDIPWNVPAGRLSVAKHQMIEIMKAVSQNAELIIMDEPTTSLTAPEKKTLFKIVKQLQSKGKTIVYISHILDEIFELCGKASILRGGLNVGTYPIQDLSKEKIAELMAGKTLIKRSRGPAQVRTARAPVLEVKNLSSPGKFDDISFSLASGEILGIAGLMGAGRTEIMRAIFGADKKSGGSIFIGGIPVDIRSPKDAIGCGIGLVPEDRKSQGVILKQEIYKNTDILNLGAVKTSGLLDRRKEFSFTNKVLQNLQTKYESPAQKTLHLSGGNQQKVAVSKWYGRTWKVMIFDEPTKGIDVNAKEDIFAVAEKFAADGAGVLFISSDLEEVLRISNRILVIHKGKIVAERQNSSEIEVGDLIRDILLSSHTNDKDKAVL